MTTAPAVPLGRTGLTVSTVFLGAGSIYHAVHTYEMPVLGGLYKKMKGTDP